MFTYEDQFTGFRFGGVHSSSLGLLRVSDGSRFPMNLLPPSADNTVSVPGGDGEYFFGSTYKSREFTVNIAFDRVTDKKIMEMRELFSKDRIQELSFDNDPLVYYLAKVSDISDFKFVPFSDNYEGIYKGEGSIKFICYDPYAKSDYFYRQGIAANGRLMDIYPGLDDSATARLPLLPIIGQKNFASYIVPGGTPFNMNGGWEHLGDFNYLSREDNSGDLSFRYQREKNIVYHLIYTISDYIKGSLLITPEDAQIWGVPFSKDISNGKSGVCTWSFSEGGISPKEVVIKSTDFVGKLKIRLYGVQFKDKAKTGMSINLPPLLGRNNDFKLKFKPILKTTIQISTNEGGTDPNKYIKIKLRLNASYELNTRYRTLYKIEGEEKTIANKEITGGDFFLLSETDSQLKFDQSLDISDIIFEIYPKHT